MEKLMPHTLALQRQCFLLLQTKHIFDHKETSDGPNNLFLYTCNM